MCKGIRRFGSRHPKILEEIRRYEHETQKDKYRHQIGSTGKWPITIRGRRIVSVGAVIPEDAYLSEPGSAYDLRSRSPNIGP